MTDVDVGVQAGLRRIQIFHTISVVTFELLHFRHLNLFSLPLNVVVREISRLVLRIFTPFPHLRVCA